MKSFNNKNYLKYLFFTIVFFLMVLVNLFQISNQQWIAFIDQDTVVIYNSLLLANNIEQEYLDHTAYFLFAVHGIFYKIFFFINLVDKIDINQIILSDNFNYYFQFFFKISRWIHVLTIFLSLVIFYKILKKLLIREILIFLSIILILTNYYFYEAFVYIRSEPLSLMFFLLSVYLLVKFYKNKKPSIIFMIGFIFTLSYFTKFQIVFHFFLVFLLLCIFVKKIDLMCFKNFFFYKYIKIIKLLNIFLLLLYLILLINLSIHPKFENKILMEPYLLILILACMYFYLKLFLKYSENEWNLFYCIISIFLCGAGSALCLFFVIDFLDFIPINYRTTLRIILPIYYMNIFSSASNIYFFDLLAMFKHALNIFSSIDFLSLFYLIFFYLITVFYIKSNNKKSIQYNFIIYIVLVVSVILFSNIFRKIYFYYLIFLIVLGINLIVHEKEIFEKLKKYLLLIFICSIFNFSYILFLGHMFENAHNNSNLMCFDINTRNYMKYWHSRFDDRFLNKFCLK